MTKEGYSTVNGAQNILLSHTTKVLSASSVKMQLQSWKSTYNVKRHYTTKHSSQFDEIVGEARVDKIEHLKKSIEKQQGVFTTYKQEKLRTGDKTEF